MIQPNKPILFVVYHSGENVENAMGLFLKTIRGKKVLYLESSQESIDQIIKHGQYNPDDFIRAFQRLALTAHKAGLKVLSLEVQSEEQAAKDYKYYAEKYLTQAFRANMDQLAAAKFTSAMAYRRSIRREKHWLEKLERVGSNTVAVTTPAHAIGIAEKLHLPPSNQVVVDRGTKGMLAELKQDREMAQQFEKELIKARLERRKKRVQQRLIQRQKRRQITKK